MKVKNNDIFLFSMLLFYAIYKTLLLLLTMDIDKYESTSYRIPFNQFDKWKEYLQVHGFVVIANYLSALQCGRYVDAFWGIMETLSDGKLDRNNKETYGAN